MSKPILIDPLQFVIGAETLKGEIPLDKLDGRLTSMLVEPEGKVQYKLSGFLDEYKRPALRLEVCASLSMPCQRCLKLVTCVVDSNQIITLFKTEAQMTKACDEEPELDAILLEPELNVVALIEDEIIISLPLSVRHEGQCGEDPQKNGQSSNPFAVLAALKKPTNDV